MRFPYVINTNTKNTYTPSTEARNLIREAGRQIFAENLEWGDKDIPSLVTLCVESISKNFETHPVIDDVFGADRDLLLEILATNLPLSIVVPLIDDEIYWKRRYSDRFGAIQERLYPDWNWKCLFIERYMRDCVEKAQPQYNDEEDIVETVKLCCPYVKRLIVTELQAWVPPLTWQLEEIPEVYPIQHINFMPILSNLSNIEELDIVYGMNHVAETFNFNMFKVSVEDCRRLANAMQTLPNLRILKLHRSKIEDNHAQALMQGIINTPSLVEIDLSHCYVGDNGALCIAKVMTVHPNLEIINLCDNNIRQTGAEGIGYALLLDCCCPLVKLDLRLNPLEHDGVMGILRSLVRGEKPKEVILAGCLFGDDTPMRVAQMLNLNRTLEVLDVSNNWFGEEGGEALLSFLKENRVIKTLEMRETDITLNQLREIRKILKRNDLADDAEFEESIEEELNEEEVEGEENEQRGEVQDGEGEPQEAAARESAQEK